MAKIRALKPDNNISTEESEPRARLLQIMYSDPPASVGWVSSEKWEHEMARKTGLGSIAVRNARVQLERIGLIEESDDWHRTGYVLTPEGYRIAHDQEMMRKQLVSERRQTGVIKKTNTQYNVLTLLLVVVGASQVLATETADGIETYALHLILVGALIAGYATIYSSPLEDLLGRLRHYFSQKK
ncbi:hypothetical protein [Haloferax sp. Atlit-6N]|uniref:hypothetical protein n=1 Tax=Haloferax sp. Atlit-6N TaxID=2077205 RepID=UPI0011C043F9|nr:hypothetical protein [Haloferax sp. Atlit-6N]